MPRAASGDFETEFDDGSARNQAWVEYRLSLSFFHKTIVFAGYHFSFRLKDAGFLAQC
jgi:uncharacterized membrane protein